MRARRSSSVTFRFYLLAAMLVALAALLPAGCATQGQAQGAGQTLAKSLQHAQATAATANRLVVVALDAGQITVDQAKAVGAAADTVVATVRYARILLGKGDAAGARAQLAALAADLAALSDFNRR